MLTHGNTSTDTIVSLHEVIRNVWVKNAGSVLVHNLKLSNNL